MIQLIMICRIYAKRVDNMQGKFKTTGFFIAKLMENNRMYCLTYVHLLLKVTVYVLTSWYVLFDKCQRNRYIRRIS